MIIDENILKTPEFSWLDNYQIRHSQRARRLQIRISSRTGLEIVVPRRCKVEQITTFIMSKRRWIEKHLANMPFEDEKQPEQIIFPAIIYVPALDEHWEVFSQHDMRKKLKQRAQNYFQRILDQLSFETGLSYKSMTVRLQKSRWGSCTGDNKISLNMALLFLPAELVRYVILHELCHTVHRNHLKRFWKLVSKFDPNYRQHAYETRRAMHYVPGWLMGE